MIFMSVALSRLVLAVFAVIVVIALSGVSFGFPEVAVEFYGSVVLNSSNASVSSNVSAFGPSGMCGSFIVKNEGYYGLLSCSGDDLETVGVEGPVRGGRVTFRVNNTHARFAGNSSWYPGAFIVLNLTAPNHEPVLSSIGSRAGVVGNVFAIDVDASDSDNDTLYYSSNSSVFVIDSSTGVVNFTPVAAHVGNYSVNFSASDGFLEDHEVVSISISPPPFCGDSVCLNENCLTCPGDCGSCPSGTDIGSSASGSGAVSGLGSGLGAAKGSGDDKTKASGSKGGEGKVAESKVYGCQEKWICTEWSSCVFGVQDRACRDLNGCGTVLTKPEEKKACAVVQPASCFNGIRDGNETDVDCGGACEPCRVKKFAEAPPLPDIGKLAELAGRLSRQIPYVFLVVMGAVMLVTVGSDWVYVRRIRRKDLEGYRRSLKRYRVFKRQVYRFLMNLFAISGVAAAYLYYYSNCMGCMVRNAYIPLVAFALIPFAVAFVIKRYQYSEYSAAKKKSRLVMAHDMQLRRLIRMENRLLLDMEENLCSQVSALLKSDIAGKVRDAVSPVYDAVREVKSLHGEKADAEIPAEVLAKASELSKDSVFTELGKVHPEFDFLVKSLLGIRLNFRKVEDYFFAVSDVKDSIEKVASDAFLMDIVKSDKERVRAYNVLVDVYAYCRKVLELFSRDEDVEMQQERVLLSVLEKFFVAKSVLPLLQTRNDLVRVYNGVIDIYNHCKRKQGIYEAVRVVKHH
ncbi:Ig-like domain-containing protein [Candidatus Woesearchaeota archaeon]|nr:Ig-like domain-containing protein [Candidatus Woesearchaeota archaeon]